MMRSTHILNDRQTFGSEKDWPVLYRFVAKLDEGFQERMGKSVQNTLGEDLTKALMGRPEIELARFEALDRMEDTLSRWTQRLCSEMPAITMEVNNFSGMPPETIFARLSDSTPLKKLMIQFRKLDLYLTGNDMPPLQSKNRFTIHLSNQVPGKYFDALLYKIGKIAFHDSVSIEAIQLQQLKGGQWQTARTFNLQPSTVEIK